MRYLKEMETRELKSREELQKAVDFYEEHDKWIRVPADHVKAFGVTDYPLFNEEIKEKLKDSCPEDCFNSCVDSAGIFLTIPMKEENKYMTFATRYTSLQSIYDRSGTNCRMVRTVNSHGPIKALSAEQRGALIDQGYRTSSEKILFLISDEMISYNGSRMYVVLPYKEGIKAVEDASGELGELTYYTGYISHEYIVAEWTVNNGEVESHRLMLEDLGIITKDDVVTYMIRFSSSNIGNSKMSARMLCSINGNKIPLGKPQYVWHLSTKAVDDQNALNDRNGASIEDFKHKLRWLGSSIKENEEIIEVMGNTVLDHPVECMENLLKFCPTIPVGVKDEAISNCKLLPGCSAVDLYLEISAIQEMAKKSLNNLIQIAEEIAQLQYCDFKKFDKKM